MRIEGNQIFADEGMLLRRKGQGTGFKRCVLLPNETEQDFEEAESFPELPPYDYNERVNELIRERYSLSEELAILRQRDTKPEEFVEYNAFAEECKAKAREERI